MAKLDLKQVTRVLGWTLLVWLVFALTTVGLGYLRNRNALAPGWWSLPCIQLAFLFSPVISGGVMIYASIDAKGLPAAARKGAALNVVSGPFVATLLGAIVWLFTRDLDLAESVGITSLVITALVVAFFMFTFVAARSRS